jgi:hypothetical protein
MVPPLILHMTAEALGWEARRLAAGTFTQELTVS